MNGYFADHAERLTDYGYNVIPISRHDDRSYTCPGKQPAQRKGWSKDARLSNGRPSPTAGSAS